MYLQKLLSGDVWRSMASLKVKVAAENLSLMPFGILFPNENFLIVDGEYSEDT